MQAAAGTMKTVPAAVFFVFIGDRELAGTLVMYRNICGSSKKLQFCKGPADFMGIVGRTLGIEG